MYCSRMRGGGWNCPSCFRAALPFANCSSIWSSGDGVVCWEADASQGVTAEGFEGTLLLSTYPKRVDLWSVYIDMMLKTGDKERVR